MTVSDHIVMPRDASSPYPYTPDGSIRFNAEVMEMLTVHAFLAASTTSLRLLTSVMVVPHRPPVLTAKVLATIDILSGGRLIVGCGAGWLREEFEAIRRARLRPTRRRHRRVHSRIQGAVDQRVAHL